MLYPLDLDGNYTDSGRVLVNLDPVRDRLTTLGSELHKEFGSHDPYGEYEFPSNESWEFALANKAIGDKSARRTIFDQGIRCPRVLEYYLLVTDLRL